MTDIALQEVKINRGQKPENKKKHNMMDTISISIKGGFDFLVQAHGSDYWIF